MHRALFIAVLVFLVCDATGVTSLIVPETCAIGTSESAPDSGCPAFCVRCACPCCAASIEIHPPAAIAVRIDPLTVVALSHSGSMPTGRVADILHVPKLS
jgi:hypothetical protein